MGVPPTLKEKGMRTVAEHLPFTFASIGVGLYFIDRFGYRWRKVTERNARRGRQYCRIAKFSFAVVYSPGDEFLEGSVLTNILDARTKHVQPCVVVPHYKHQGS